MWGVCQTRVSSTRNSTFTSGNTLGHVFGGTKNPCGNGDTHSLGFPYKNTVLGYMKTLGRVLGGIKPLREWGHALPRFSSQKHSFWLQKTLGRVFGGTKSPCGNGDTHSLVLGKYRSRTPVSNLGSPGCVVRVPAHWAI